jgi:hypothetical protein
MLEMRKALLRWVSGIRIHTTTFGQDSYANNHEPKPQRTDTKAKGKLLDRYFHLLLCSWFTFPSSSAKRARKGILLFVPSIVLQ